MLETIRRHHQITMVVLSFLLLGIAGFVYSVGDAEAQLAFDCFDLPGNCFGDKICATGGIGVGCMIRECADCACIIKCFFVI